MKREILAFVVDKDCPWPQKQCDFYRLLLGEPVQDAKRDLDNLQEFKKWLAALGSRSTLTDQKELQTAVLGALHDWKQRHGGGTAPPKPQADPTKYLVWLRQQTAWIDIRGLQVGDDRAHRFPISDLFIPLTIITRDGRKMVRLEEALLNRRLVIVGQEEHVGKFKRREDAPSTKHSPAWLVHFLKTQNEEYRWDLDAEFFEAKVRSEDTVLLLDGLDESPSRVRREDMARLFEEAAQEKFRFVVTTRSGSYTGNAILAGFHEVWVDELGKEAVEAFLGHWSHSRFPQDAASAERHRQELVAVLRGRIEIRRMAPNPLMLTALAVVHWNERRLPEQRADLYESIAKWLARAREQRPGRASAFRCLELLGVLALAMQTEARGRMDATGERPRRRGHGSSILGGARAGAVPESSTISGRRRGGQRHHSEPRRRGTVLALDLPRISGRAGGGRTQRGRSAEVAVRRRQVVPA